MTEIVYDFPAIAAALRTLHGEAPSGPTPAPALPGTGPDGATGAISSAVCSTCHGTQLYYVWGMAHPCPQCSPAINSAPHAWYAPLGAVCLSYETIRSAASFVTVAEGGYAVPPTPTR